MVTRYWYCALVLFLTSTAFGQGKVTITGRFLPAIENTQLSVYKPISGNFNMSFPDQLSETVIKDGKFTTTVILDKPGFIRLQSKGMPKTYFFAEPGDEINITFRTDTAGITNALYAGNNAEVNNLLDDRKLLNDPSFFTMILPGIFKSESSTDVLISLLEMEARKATQPLTDLFNRKEISAGCYQAMKAETEQTLLFWTNNFLKNYFISEEDLKQVTKIDRKAMGTLAGILYTKYDPFSPANQVSTRAYNNSLIKCILIEDKIIESGTTRTPLWSAYDKEFATIVSRLAAIDLAPDDIQMSFLGTSLVTATVFKPMSDEDFIRIFNIYYQKFPQSPFNPILTAYINEMGAAPNTQANKVEFGVYWLGEKSGQLVEQDFKGIDQTETIQALIKKYFKGTPVFVDFWATWCSPCIAEFKFEPMLHSRLEELGVKTLYVSIDHARAMANWKKLVIRYQLGGYHYLASQPVRANMDKWFFGIPRYMLFNSAGEVVNDNLLRPSDQEKLVAQIKGLLRK